MFVRLTISVVWVLFLSSLVFAQAPEIDATTPEGELLAKIGLSQDSAEKLTLLKQFAQTYPAHAGFAWVLSQQAQLHHAQNAHSEALAAATALFALDPAQAAVTHRVRTAALAVKSAEALGQPEGILRWAKHSHQSAEELLSAKAPEDFEEDAWTAEKAYAKQVSQYADYAHLLLATKSTDAAEVSTYGEALRVLNPDSEYLPAIVERQFVVARASNNRELAVPAAEALTETGKGSDETLLYLASVYLETKQKQDKIIPYTDSALEKLKSKPRPESVTEEEWKKQTDFSTGLAHWVQGLHHATGSRWAQANKSLRSALPLIGGNATMQAAAYFYLGIANFEIGKRSKDHKEIVDAVKFTELCTKMRSPYQAQAKQNLTAIQGQFRMR